MPLATITAGARAAPDRRASRALLAVIVAGWCGMGCVRLPAGGFEEGFEGAGTACNVVTADGDRLLVHDRQRAAAHRGQAGERVVVEARSGPALRLELPLDPAAVIDELRAVAWLRSNRADLRLAVRVRLPGWVSRQTGKPVEVLVPGSASREIDRWELVSVESVPRALARQLPALRLEHGPGGLEGAVVTHLVVDAYSGPGRYEIAMDDVSVTGLVTPTDPVPPRRVVQDPRVVSAAAETVVDPPAGLTRGVLEVDGLPFHPRSIDWAGEPLEFLAGLGFNCVRFAEPASGEQLAAARAAGLWVICPPPPIPDVDVRDPASLPVLRNWDRVLMWDMGTGLSEDDVAELAERGRRVRACDVRQGRPLVGSADSGLRAVSRHVDMLVARRTVLGTSLELADYLTWLRERPRLARPGTPFLATLSTEIDPRAAAQAAAVSGVGGRGLAVDTESLSLAAFTAVAAGARGILFTSARRLDGDDPESRSRAAAARDMNLRLAVLEPWGAAGRFAAQAQTSSPEVQAFVMEAARARVVVAWRCVQGAQVVARRYAGGDLPPDAAPLTILVPGAPEAHQAWEVAAGGLRPAKQRRVTGGMSVTLDDFLTHAIVLVSGEPAVTAHVQRRVRDLAPLQLASARALAAAALAGAGEMLGRLPPQAFSGPPPVAAVPMLTEAGRLAAEGEALAAPDPAAAIRALERAAAIAGQFERRVWENGVKAEGSMVASPLTASDATLAEQWQFVAARTAAAPGPELLAGGGMERIDELSGGGWRHFARAQADVRTGVEIARDRPASGNGYLQLRAVPSRPDDAPVVVETPPVWIMTPPIDAPVGKLVEISAQVRVPAAITGSVDGLFVFDSLGGPALGERVGASSTWRRLVLHRVVPADVDGPLVVTFALTGLGSAAIDDVSIRVVERAAAGGVAALPVAARAAEPAFPGPADLLAPPAGPPPAAPAAAWPGMSVEWPSLLPFGAAPDAPPPGPGGGTIDPFKRARPRLPAP